MANFIKLAATVKRLIDKNGRTVTITKQGKTPTVAAQPWRGQSANPTVLDTVSGKAVFVSTEPGSLGAQWMNRDNTKRSDQVAFFSATDAGTVALETYDTITDAGSQWKIVRAQRLKPGDTSLLFVFEVDR